MLLLSQVSKYKTSPWNLKTQLCHKNPLFTYSKIIGPNHNLIAKCHIILHEEYGKVNNPPRPGFKIIFTDIHSSIPGEWLIHGKATFRIHDFVKKQYCVHKHSVKKQEVFRKKPLASKDDFSNELLVFRDQKKKLSQRLIILWGTAIPKFISTSEAKGLFLNKASSILAHM